MATRTKFPADKGLAARMTLTMFLLGLLYVAFIGLLIAVGVQYSVVLVIAAILLFCQYWFSDKIALYSMGGHLVSREEEPELHAIVERLCALANMPKPRVAIAEVDYPNAFATGRNQRKAVVCATRGLLRRLDEPEVEAVLAHELSHVAHKDVVVMTIASFLGIVAGMLTRMALWAGMFGGYGYGGGYGRGGNRNQQGNIFLLEFGVLLVSLVVYAISFLLTRALSRYRELSADRSGALLIGRPSLLASALVKVTGEMARIPQRDMRKAEAFNAFFFAPALTRGISLSTLFATHPPLEKRLEQLHRLEVELSRIA